MSQMQNDYTLSFESGASSAKTRLITSSESLAEAVDTSSIVSTLWEVNEWYAECFKPTSHAFAYAKTNTGHWKPIEIICDALSSARPTPIADSISASRTTPSATTCDKFRTPRILRWDVNLASPEKRRFPFYGRQKLQDQAWLSVLQIVDLWSTLTDDWFDEDSKAPSTTTIVAAREFVSRLIKSLPPPSPYLAPDGEIGFRWNTSNGRCSISLLPDGDLVGAVQSATDGFVLQIDMPFDFWHDYDILAHTIRQYVYK